VTRDQLLADLLLERYQPTRAESVGGWATEPPDDSEVTTKRRRNELERAVLEHEKAKKEAS
jgi:hypothetical protein